MSDLGEARARLRRVGAELHRPRHLEDNLLFDDEGGTLQRQGVLLRLRRTPYGGLLTFKGPRELSGGVKSREERETGVADADALQAVLVALGYRTVFRYQKYRESWRLRGQAVEVDETPIGSFLEIEGDRDGIAEVASLLGYAERDYVGESYVGLFFAAGGTGDMVFGSGG